MGFGVFRCYSPSLFALSGLFENPFNCIFLLLFILLILVSSFHDQSSETTFQNGGNGVFLFSILGTNLFCF